MLRVEQTNPQSRERERNDRVLVLPWNLRDEIVKSMAVIHSWGGKFVFPIPTVEVVGGPGGA